MKNKIAVLSVFLLIILLAIWRLGSGTAGYRDIFIILSGLGIVVFLYILNRVSIFSKKLQLALRHIMENNFSTGISMSGRDEAAIMAKKFNAAIDRINAFDVLRAQKIDILSRIMSTISRNIHDGVMIFDLQSARMKLNKAAQDIFGVNQDELSIDSIVKLEANHEFNRLYQEIISLKVNNISADIEFFLPVLKAKAKVNLKMLAVKDQDERLNSVICIIYSCGANNTDVR